MAPKKSIFRGPDAQHFQLVHRSLRDPLINDHEASQRVLKPVERGNDRDKGYTLADLDATIDKSKMRENEGEAALYGITYDDSKYDYMAHLRPIEGGFDSFMIPAPRGSGVAKGMKGDRKGKSKELFVADDFLASKEEVPLNEVYGREESIPRELQGLQPDMDPHLRQVLEALDDDAFIDGEEGEDDEGGDFWGELVAGGEADEYEREEFEFEEWGVDDRRDKSPDVVEREDKEETWEDRFKAFKQAQREGKTQGSGVGSDGEIERSEMADTLGSMVSGMEDLIVKGGKKRRGKRGPSDASGMSMSSSSMFRTQGLRDLDARFDKVERDYDLDDDDEEWDDNTSMAASTISGISRTSGMSEMSGMSGISGMSSSSRRSLYSNASAAPPEVSREDFDAILGDFLENYEVVGRRMRPALGGTGLTGVEKLSVLRSAVEGEGEDKDANRQLVLEIERLGRGQKAPKEKREKVKLDPQEKWDVETILSTYTNTENHPAVIGTRSAAEKRRRAEHAALAQQTGPSVPPPRSAQNAVEDTEEAGEDDSGSETEMDEPKVTVARPKGESVEERRARKSAVKAERAARRAEKKSHTATFGEERKKQLASHKKMVGGGKAADVAVGTRGVVSLR